MKNQDFTLCISVSLFLTPSSPPVAATSAAAAAAVSDGPVSCCHALPSYSQASLCVFSLLLSSHLISFSLILSHTLPPSHAPLLLLSFFLSLSKTRLDGRRRGDKEDVYE